MDQIIRISIFSLIRDKIQDNRDSSLIDQSAGACLVGAEFTTAKKAQIDDQGSVYYIADLLTIK
jgi:hypothetical protein